MSLKDYKDSLKLTDPKKGFQIEAFIMAILRKGDCAYTDPIRKAFPDVANELRQRVNSVGGKLRGE